MFLRACKFKISIFLLVAASIPAMGAASPAEGFFKKKVALRTWQDPADWRGSYSPGRLLTRILEIRLRELDRYQLMATVESQATAAGGTRMDAVNTGSRQSPAAQIQIRGNVLQWPAPPTSASNRAEKNASSRKGRRAEIQAAVELFDPHAGRVLARKTFAGRSDQGRRLPIQGDRGPDPESAAFRESSLGMAVDRVMRSAARFIRQELALIPMQGKLVEVNPEEGWVTINLGAANGLHLQDEFIVFDFQPQFTDPETGVDLGDKFIRQGVVWVNRVSRRYARARIMAGEGFKPGQIVRARPTSRPHFVEDSPLSNDRETVPWWAFDPGKKLED